MITSVFIITHLKASRTFQNILEGSRTFYAMPTSSEPLDEPLAPAYLQRIPTASSQHPAVAVASDCITASSPCPVHDISLSLPPQESTCLSTKDTDSIISAYSSSSSIILHHHLGPLSSADIITPPSQSPETKKLISIQAHANEPLSSFLSAFNHRANSLFSNGSCRCSLNINLAFGLYVKTQPVLFALCVF